MIRVLHVTEDHSSRNTGISSAVDGLTRCMPDWIQPALGCVGEETLPLKAGLGLTTFPTWGPGAVWRYSPGQRENLAKVVAAADVVHLHGLWMWIQWAVARSAVRFSR